MLVFYTASGICTCCSFGRGISASPHTDEHHDTFSSAIAPTLLSAMSHGILLCKSCNKYKCITLSFIHSDTSLFYF